MNFKKHLLAAAACAALALCAMPSLALPGPAPSPPAMAAAEADLQGEVLSQSDMLSLAQVLGRVANDYVDEVPSKDFFRLAVDGILSKLDAHTSYMDKEEFKRFSEEMKQDYAGIGVTVSVPPGKELRGLMVEELFPGGPADQAGIRQGDLIQSVDGKALDMVLEQNVKMVRGPEGAVARLGVLRGGELIHIQAKRAKVSAPSAFGAFCECDGAKAYFIRLSGFHYETGSEVAALLEQAAAKSPKAILIDLRDNPGGSLSASVEVASLFLPDDSIVVSSRERGSPDRFMGSMGMGAAAKIRAAGAIPEPLSPEFASRRAQLLSSWPQLAALPVYAMANAGSASASEIVAAALKDNGRALIVGERTFGKGSVQNIAELPNGGALRLTIARYFTPSGQSIQALGVEPDVAVADERPWRISSLANAKQRYEAKAPVGFPREADLPRHLGASYVSMDEQAAKEEREFAEQMDQARPKANEPYERKFSYAPMGSDGSPDSLTKKALELARAGAIPKPRGDWSSAR